MDTIGTSLIPLFKDYTFLVILSGTSLLGILCSILGSFMVLRRESLIGDCLAHSSYPGIILAFLLIGVKSLPAQLFGAFLSALLAIVLLIYSKRITRLPFDGLLATILSTFFGLGIVLMSYVQRLNNANQSGIKTFIFGQAATLLYEDVLAIMALTVLTLTMLVLFWKELKLLTFDAEYAFTMGIPIKLMQGIFSLFSVMTVLLAIQSVGIILMSALLIAPSIAARQWVKSLGALLILASLVGVVSAAGGTVISSLYPKIPTGPSIVALAASFALLSIFLGTIYRKCKKASKSYAMGGAL